MSRPDSEFLNWMYLRLINVYGESPNVDFMQRLQLMSEAAEKREEREREIRWLAHSPYNTLDNLPATRQEQERIEALSGWIDAKMEQRP